MVDGSKITNPNMLAISDFFISLKFYYLLLYHFFKSSGKSIEFSFEVIKSIENNWRIIYQGIYDGNCSSDPYLIDHGVLLVGYGSENGDDYWIVKNSWSKNWGDKGYMYLKRNTKDLPYGKCAILASSSYPTINHTSFIHKKNHTSSSQKSRSWGIWIMVCIFISELLLI